MRQSKRRGMNANTPDGGCEPTTRWMTYLMTDASPSILISKFRDHNEGLERVQFGDVLLLL